MNDEKVKKCPRPVRKFNKNPRMENRSISPAYVLGNKAEKGALLLGKEGDRKNRGENELEGIMLIRHAVEVKKVAEQKREERNTLVDMEPEMRDDHLLKS